MITSGRQIKAARALAGIDQSALAAAAGIHRNAVVYWEARDTIVLKPEPFAVHAMRKALKAAGVITMTNPATGVSLCVVNNLPHPAPEVAQ